VWCGDSRAYSHLPGSDTLEPITRDHASPWPPHALLSCLGDHDGFEPESFEVTPVPGQRILICSDGLTGMLDDDEIARILRNGGTVDDLVTAARPNSHDNITVALIDCDTFR
jgi:protein phosphatase